MSTAVEQPQTADTSTSTVEHAFCTNHLDPGPGLLAVCGTVASWDGRRAGIPDNPCVVCLDLVTNSTEENMFLCPVCGEWI